VRKASVLLLLSGIVVLAGCGGGSSEPESTESFTNETWGTVVSDPASHEGATVELVGRVFGVQRDEDGTYMQVWMDPKNSEQNTIVGHKQPDFQVAEEDYVRVKGTVGEEFEGENLFGAELTVPTVLASSVEVVDATAAAGPAHTTYPPATQAMGGVRMTVSKIEAAADETRVYVAVNNQSAADFSFHSFSSKLVANGRAVKTSFNTTYEEPASDVPAHSRTSGVIVFNPIPDDARLRLELEGYSENSDVGNYGSLSWTFAWK
jgi:hypothetical protein